MKKIKIPLGVIFTIIWLALLFIFAWALTFFAYNTAFLSFLGLVVFLPVKIINRRYLFMRAGILLIGIILLIATINISIGEVNRRIKTLSEKPREKSSLPVFSLRDKMGIYGLNAIMGVLAYPVYPEVSRETLMMIFPPPKRGVRVFHSNFPLHSEKIKDIITMFKADLLNRQSGEEFQVQKRIDWPIRDYCLGKKEARYALALNPSRISLAASRKASGWLIDVSIKVMVRYPQNSSVTLLSEPELKVEEGLFWILQQEGWLFPYTAEWKFTINTADKRMI